MDDRSLVFGAMDFIWCLRDFIWDAAVVAITTKFSWAEDQGLLGLEGRKRVPSAAGGTLLRVSSAGLFLGRANDDI